MRNPHGYGRIFCDSVKNEVATQNGRTIKGSEHDTFRCGHCMAVVLVAPKERPEDIGGMCHVCMSLVCPHCVETGKCDPLEEKLTRIARTQDWRRWYLDSVR